MKVALVHDDFIQSGGAESLFAAIASLFPKAPIYTSLVNWNKLPDSISKERVKTSFLQKIPFKKHLYKILLPLYPLAFETFDFSNFDLVISSTTRFSKGIVTSLNTTHICYINSAPRFLWDKEQKKQYLQSSLAFIVSPIMSWLKRWDKAASSRPDYYIANSQNVQNRIRKYYERESIVIYPFADTNFYQIPKIHNWQLKGQKYFLIVSRLVKWKKIEIAIKACKELGINLKIAGIGPDEARLRRLTGTTIELVGQVEKERLRELYQNAQALIVTQEEDFGISAVEAQACGVPVIAYEKGGQKEIIVSGKTGILFEKQTENSLKDAILASSKVKWEISACRKNSLRFSKATFVRELKTYVTKHNYNS